MNSIKNNFLRKPSYHYFFINLCLICTPSILFSMDSPEGWQILNQEEEKILQNLLDEEFLKLKNENEEYRQVQNSDKLDSSFWKELDRRVHERYLKENPMKLPKMKTSEEKQKEEERIQNEVRLLIDQQRGYSQSFLNQKVPSTQPSDNNSSDLVNKVLDQAALSGEIKNIVNGEGISAFLKRKKCERLTKSKKCNNETENNIESQPVKTWKYVQSLADLMLSMSAKMRPYDDKKSLFDNIMIYLNSSNLGNKDLYNYQKISDCFKMFKIYMQMFTLNLKLIGQMKNSAIYGMQMQLDFIQSILQNYNGLINDPSAQKLIGFMSEVIKELDQVSSDEGKTMVFTKIETNEEAIDGLIKDVVDKAELFVSRLKLNVAELATKIVAAEEKHPNEFVFYHGMTEDAGSLYDIINGFRHKLVISGRQGIAALRAFDTAFENMPTVREFYHQWVDESGDQDHSAWYRLRGISATPSLFSFMEFPGESSLMYFILARNVNPINLQESLEDLFINFGFEDGSLRAKKYVDYFASIKKQNNLPNGRLLQIFIDPSIVDKIAYTSKPFGSEFSLKIENKETSEPSKVLSLLRNNPAEYKSLIEEQYRYQKVGWVPLSDPNNSQVRLFLSPEIMLDPKLVQIVDYKRYPDQYPGNYQQKISQMVDEDIKDWLKLPQAEKNIENKMHGSRIPNLLQLKKMMSIPSPEKEQETDVP